ncbi:MAG: hypothetical protein RIC35_20420 [Marinoscillum sp.]
MKKGIVVLCRFNSSRVPGKILKKIADKELLLHITDRIRQTSYPFTIATSVEHSDDPIEAFCLKHNLPIFRGSLENVAERFFQAAQDLKLDYAARINGDNLFLDTDLLKTMFNDCTSFDFVSNVPGRTFPYGMSVEIVSTSFYHRLLPEIAKDPYYFEHVTSYLYKHDDMGNRKYFKNTQYPSLSQVQLAVDTPDDLNRVSEIVSKLPEGTKTYTLYQLSEIVKKWQ